jgi:ribosomal protein S18 acetylase RimI-like enzyme
MLNTPTSTPNRRHSDTELVRFAEHIEARAWLDIVNAAPTWLRTQAGLHAEECDGVTLLAASRLDSVLFNRVIGLGERAPTSDAQIATIMDRYWTIGIERYWIHVGPYARPAPIARLMRAHNLKAHRRSWVRMVRPAKVVTRAPTELNVREATLDDATAIASIVGGSFDLPQLGAEMFASLVDRRRWRIFVAEHGREVMAAGGVFSEGEVAYLAFAATRPEFRCRGAQRALMQARINAAVDDGCRWLATATGFPLAADESSPAYHNMLWAGFRPVAIRDNYAPEARAH